MRKAEVLLACLALAPGLRHPRDRLINLLWSDRSDEQARNSLRQCLSAIRKSLGPAADMILLVDRTTVCLNAELIDVDVHEFERLATVGDYDSLSTAAGLYQGEFLEGISIRDAACQEWLDSERGRFKRQFVEILSNLAETQLVTHDFVHAIISAERLVEQDPLGESGWRLLMRSYAGKGDRNHALQAYKRCQQCLRDELDVEPEAATTELRDQIAAGESRPMEKSATEARPDTISDAPGPFANTSSDHSIAVLPFDNLSGDPEQEYFSDGITDSIILNLSLFPGLRVKSRNSSFAFKQQIKSLGEISKELEVDYIVEGSIRKSAERIRITVQLIEAASGNHVWGKRYDADIEDLFDLEEDLSRSIAATVTGKIESELQRIAIEKGATDQHAYDLLLAGRYYYNLGTQASTATAIELLNKCIGQDPDNARAHALLSNCHGMTVLDRWTEDIVSSKQLAAEHMRKAVEIAPDLNFVRVAYADFLSFQSRYEEAESQLQRVLERNPNNTEAITMRAVNLSNQGKSEAALEQAELVLKLDPYHPWVRWIKSESLFLCGRYEDCLDTIASIEDAPGFIRIYKVAANVELGRMEDSQKSMVEFQQFSRDNMLSLPISIEDWRDYYRDNAPFADPAVNDRVIDLLVEAGLEDELGLQIVPGDVDSIPSIAVLPFENMSGDPEQEYFSDGITTSIIVSLGLFDGLTVKSQNSSFAFKDSGKSSEDIAETLKVTYLVEGSIRKSASNVRVSVQLIESASGNQVWGKHYDAELEDILQLEQELSHSIAATISGRIGHKLQQSVFRKPAKNLQSYDYLLRGLYHLGKFSAADLEIAKKEISKCLEIDPENAAAHFNIGEVHCIEAGEGWTKNRQESEGLALKHLQTALQLEPDNALAHAYMADFLNCSGEFVRGEFHADKAIELNPTGAEGYFAKADILRNTRRIEEAIPYADKSLQLDPHSVGAGWAAGGVYQSAGQYGKAIKTFRSISHLPASLHAQIAVCFIGLGLAEEAHKEMQRYLELAREQLSNYPQTEEEWRLLWRDYSNLQYDEDFDDLFDLLKQAGLCEDLAANGDQ